MGQNLIYAGIGARSTPDDILTMMSNIALDLALGEGWTLRSGYADGADMAFYRGAHASQGRMEIFLPWAGFNGAPRYSNSFIVPRMTAELMTLAAQYHPAGHRCSDTARRLHARNGCQRSSGSV